MRAGQLPGGGEGAPAKNAVVYVVAEAATVEAATVEAARAVGPDDVPPDDPEPGSYLGLPGSIYGVGAPRHTLR
jgi:hypothetical protein